MVDLQAKAKWIRQQLFEMGVPLPSCLSCVEILVALYYQVKQPNDIVIISKGHGAAARYPILEDLGLIPAGSMKEYRRPGGLLKLYAEPSIPETHVPCASLGIGFGVAAGMAFADRSRRVFVILGDSECYEGSIWETAMWAAHHGLTNLIAILDRNGHGVMGKTENCVKQESVGDKWRAFNWDVDEIDGHNLSSLVRALNDNPRCSMDSDGGVFIKDPWRPMMIIAKTIKAKGISFWEDKENVHSAVMTPAEKEQARKELWS